MPESRESSKGDFLGIFRNFQEYVFCRTSESTLVWNEAMKKSFDKYIHRKPPVMVSFELQLYGLEHGCLQFYLKGGQSQILSCKTCEVLQSFSFTQHYLLLGNCFWFPATFVTYRFLYQQYINSATISCLRTPDIATFKWSTLLVLKMFKGNKKKQVESNILVLRLNQQTKGYVVEAVAQRYSAKKVPWNIWKNSQENACTGDVLILNL